MNPLRPDEWRRLRDVFDRAMALPAGERPPFMANACLGDEGLHRRVATLVAAHERARNFLETDCFATITKWRDQDFTGAQFGPYLLESRIGGGGMGEVYRARDTRLRRTVAIKVLLSHTTADESAHERFEREARVVAGLNHPHICTLHDIGTYRAETGQRPAPYLVMEFLNGQTLADRLANGALSAEAALDYALQIASALAAAHRAGIVHRDLKPKNVMLTSAGAKLLDFGLAKAAASSALDQAATFDSDLTTPGTIIGTVQYMAPEQLEGSPTDARTDVFAFGCVFYEMLSGRPAFEGPGSARLMAAIIARQPTPLRELVPSLPDGVEALIMRSLAKNPADRWTSAADLLAELERIQRDVRSVDQPGWFHRIVRQHRVAAAAVLIVLLLTGAAAVFLRSRSPADVSSVVTAPAVQLAVLPLRMVGEAIPGDAYLGVGIADSIITRLAPIRQIGLRPTAAVINYAAYDGDPATVAKELEVGHVLLGTIQRSEDTYRITLQLVQASQRAVTWARSYDVLRTALTN